MPPAGKVMEFAGKPNVADYIPILKRFDPQRIRRTTQFHVEEGFRIIGEFIKERIESMENGLRNNQRNLMRKDYLDVLLEFHGDGIEEPSRFSSTTVYNIVLVSNNYLSTARI